MKDLYNVHFLQPQESKMKYNTTINFEGFQSSFWLAEEGK